MTLKRYEEQETNKKTSSKYMKQEQNKYEKLQQKPDTLEETKYKKLTAIPLESRAKR